MTTDDRMDRIAEAANKPNPSDDFVNNWPMYVTDNDEVTCYEDGCIENSFIGYGRRKTFGEIRQDLIDHIKEIHGYPKESSK